SASNIRAAAIPSEYLRPDTVSPLEGRPRPWRSPPCRASNSCLTETTPLVVRARMNLWPAEPIAPSSAAYGSDCRGSRYEDRLWFSDWPAGGHRRRHGGKPRGRAPAAVAYTLRRLAARRTAARRVGARGAAGAPGARRHARHPQRPPRRLDAGTGN